jgi:hypothetical protein
LWSNGGLGYTGGVPLWSRLRRRSFAPRRPAVLPEQWPLVAVTLLALAIGIAAVLVALTA